MKNSNQDLQDFVDKVMHYLLDANIPVQVRINAIRLLQDDPEAILAIREELQAMLA